MNILKSLLLSTLIISTLYSQWTRVDFQDVKMLSCIDFYNITGILAGHDTASVKIYRSTDGGNIWNAVDLPDLVRSIGDLQMLNDNTIYACGAKLIGLTHDVNKIKQTERPLADLGFNTQSETEGLFIVSQDGGETWNIKGTFPDSIIYLKKMHFPDKDNGYAIVTSVSGDILKQGIIRTTDGGSTWNWSLYLRSDLELESISFHDSLNGFASGSELDHFTYHAKLFKTTDGGLYWDELVDGRFFSFWSLKFLAADNIIMIAQAYADTARTIYKSSDGGYSFQSIKKFPKEQLLQEVSVLKDLIIGYGNIHTYPQISFPFFFEASFDKGENWLSNLFNPPMERLYISDSKLLNDMVWFLIGTQQYEYGTLLKTANNGGLHVKESEIEPDEFYLYQNYPNPFNPFTVIKFELPAAENVILRIYDILGREVTVLLNEFRQAGIHEIKFDGNSFPAGVYFYEVKSNSYTDVKKMLLLK
jgi:hypothetical protein